MMQQNDINPIWRELNHDLVITLYNQDKYVKMGLLLNADCIGNINCYKLNCDVQIFLQYFPEALHYLDRFWLLLPATIKEQQTLWQEFYRVYSAIYNQLIDCDHNLLCLENFKQILKGRLSFSEQSRLFDFGCGIGLSANIFNSHQLVCYDSNEKMRYFALGRGLMTINTFQFHSLSACSFDGCIACYVLHMAIDERDIKQLAKIITNGGIIVANFYKGIQEDRVNHIIIENGLSIEQLEGRQGQFGSIYVYKKN